MLKPKNYNSQSYYDCTDISKAKQWRDIINSPVTVKRLSSVLKSILKKHFPMRNRPIDWIDVGCGLGRSSLVAKSLGMHYTGIDYSKKHIDFCMNNYEYGKFICDNWLLHKGKYDIVSFISSLHHFQNWKAALNKALLLLRRNGIVLIDHEPNRLYSRIFRFYAIHCLNVDSDQIGNIEIHWFKNPSILPSDLPDGDVTYHFDYFPILNLLKLNTKSPFIGQYFESYRKIIKNTK